MASEDSTSSETAEVAEVAEAVEATEVTEAAEATEGELPADADVDVDAPAGAGEDGGGGACVEGEQGGEGAHAASGADVSRIGTGGLETVADVEESGEEAAAAEDEPFSFDAETSAVFSFALSFCFSFCYLTEGDDGRVLLYDLFFCSSIPLDQSNIETFEF